MSRSSSSSAFLSFVVCFAGLAPPAAAQDPDRPRTQPQPPGLVARPMSPRSPRVRGPIERPLAPQERRDGDRPLSPRERGYVDQLAGMFGPVSFADRSRIERVVAPMLPPGGSGPATTSSTTATGLLVRAGDTTIARYRFDTPLEAQEEVARMLHQPGESRPIMVGEVRGNQVLVLSGDVALDPAAARRALDAAWQGLPAASASDATFAMLGPDDLVLTTTLKDGPLRDEVDRAMAKARERAEQPGFEVGERDARVKLPSGTEAYLTSDEHGATARLGAPGGPATAEYLALLDPEADAAAADQVGDAAGAVTEGAAKTLEGLFD